jgi:hypothetical protein
MRVAQRSAATRSILFTVAISTVTTAVIGSLVYYSLERHDRIHGETMERIAVEAQWQRALAAGRVVGALSRHVIHDAARLQELVNTGSDSEGLQDLLVVNGNNVVLAAKDVTQVGQRLDDAAWRAWKGSNREVAQRAVDQAGRPVLVIVEPLKDSSDVRAWVMLVFAWPEHRIAILTMTERLQQTGWVMAPVFVCLLISIGLAMQLAANGIRRQIRTVLLTVLEDPALPGAVDPWRKVP